MPLSTDLMLLVLIGLCVSSFILLLLFLFLQRSQISKLVNQVSAIQVIHNEEKVSEQLKHQEVMSLLNNVANESQSIKLYVEQQLTNLKMKLLRQGVDNNEKQQTVMQAQHEQILKALHEHQQQFSHNQHKAVDQLVEHLSLATKSNREELTKSLQATTTQLTQGIESLTQSTDKRLKEISGEVEKRLTEGFEKTTKTFNDIVQRLALIDDAQKKITELSSNVVSLQ